MSSEHENDASWWEGFFRGPFGELQLAEHDEAHVTAEVNAIEARLALTPGSRVLDVPCGAGRHALELARRGHRLTAVDFNGPVVEEARRRAKHVAVDLRVGDMRDPAALPRDQDAAFCWFGSFGYFDDEANLGFLRNVAASLRPGGRFALDTHVTETIYPIFGTRGWRWVGEGEARRRVIEERSYDVASADLRVDWTFQGPEGEQRAVSVIKLYGYRELAGMMREAGFVDLQAYDGLTERPFSVGSSRLTLVARRA